jgi:hypothetical protein
LYREAVAALPPLLLIYTTNMETATQRQTKRTRFDSSAKSPADADLSPLAAGKNVLLSHCASLQPEIATLLRHLGLNHLQTLSQVHRREATLKKMTDDEASIPRSARVQFVLTSSKLVEEDPGYTGLKAETEALVDEFQKALRLKILAAANIELTMLRRKVTTDYATNLFLTAKALLICDGLTASDPHQIVVTLISEYDRRLLSPCNLLALEFLAIYKHAHLLTTLPAPIAVAPTIGHDEMPVITPVLECFVKIQRVVHNIFIGPWDSFLSTQRRIDVTAALKSLRVAHLEPTATDDAAMLLDQEPAVDPPQLRAIVDSQVNKKTAALQKELSSLRSQMVQLQKKGKNSPRGPPSGASLKKKQDAPVAVPGSATSNAAGSSPLPRSSSNGSLETSKSRRRKRKKGSSGAKKSSGRR